MAGMELIAGVALQQALSPQMQQSLQLLQAPVAELQQLVASELASNPLLEEEGSGSEKLEVEDSPAEDFVEEQNAFTLQDEWRDYLLQGSTAGSYSSESEEHRRFLFESQVSRQTLRNFVIDQAAGLPDGERQVVELIAGSLDEDGYLRISRKILPLQRGFLRVFWSVCLPR